MNRLEQARAVISETDDEMARLFVRRMRAVEEVAQYKKEHGLPITDAVREEQILRRSADRVEEYF